MSRLRFPFRSAKNMSEEVQRMKVNIQQSTDDSKTTFNHCNNVRTLSPNGEGRGEAIIRSSTPFIIILLALFIFFPSYSQDREKLEKERKKLEQEIEYTKKLLKETSENKQLTLNQLQTLRQQIQLREKVIGNINKEMSVIDEQLDETSAIIVALEEDLVELKKEYAGMLYNMYKNRSALNQLIFIFNAESFNDAFARVRYLQQFGEFRKKQAEVIEETKLSLERKRQEQMGRKTDKQKLLETEQSQRKKLDEEKEETDKIITQLKKQEKHLGDDIEKKRQAADNLSKKIEEIIKREIEAAKKRAEAEAAKTKTTSTKTNVLSATPEAAKLSAGFASNQGRLPWPVEKGVICESFGEHAHPVLKSIKIVNNGVDVCTNTNAQARSLFQGTVITVMYNPGFQRAVMLRHGEYFTVYSNLKEVFVSTGDEVTVKQPLGLVYTDEKAGESKVHLELWKGTQKLNPALWIYPNNQ